MSAPVFSSVALSSYTDGATPCVTSSLTWSTGDLIIVIGCTEDNATTLGVPTATGLSFSTITSTNTASNTKVYAWQATAGSSGSGAVSSVVTESGGHTHCGITAFAISNNSGVGNTALMASTGTTNATQSLTRSGNNSGVIVGMGDWNAVNDTAVTTNPTTAGTVDAIKRVASVYTAYVGHWDDQGSAGATSYGIGSYTATAKWIGLVIEVLGLTSSVADGSLWAGHTIQSANVRLRSSMLPY